MKTKANKKRNSLAVRLTDLDHEKFLETTGKNYSETLRELIILYSSYFLEEDRNLPIRNRVEEVIKRASARVQKVEPEEEW
jgi:hypothetical protein